MASRIQHRAANVVLLGAAAGVLAAIVFGSSTSGPPTRGNSVDNHRAAHEPGAVQTSERSVANSAAVALVDPPRDPTEVTAEQIRREFDGCSLSSAQVSALVAAQSAWLDMRAELAARSPTQEMQAGWERADLEVIDGLRDAEYRRILGDDAFVGWRRKSNASLRALQCAPEAQGLDAQLLDTVHTALCYYQLAVADVRCRARLDELAGASIDWTAVDRELATHTAHAMAMLRAMLGDDRFERMQHERLFGLLDHDSPRDVFAAPMSAR